MVLGFSYRLQPHLLWQIYGVENVDFIPGGLADRLSRRSSLIDLNHNSASVTSVTAVIPT